MALRRVLALLLAIAMIGGAWYLRTAREEQARRASGEDIAGTLTLTCADVLMELCGELALQLRDDGHDVATQPAAVPSTAGGQAEPGALITLAPLHELAAGSSPTGQQTPASEPAVLARTPLVAAMYDQRAEVLEAHCGGALSWRCVGDAVESGRWADIGGDGAWGVIRPFLPDPGRSEVGLLALGQVAAGYFGSDQVSRQQVLDDIGFYSWFARLLDATPPSSAGDPLQRMAATGAGGGIDVLAVAEADAVEILVAAAARAPGLRLHAIEPVVTADAVVVPVGQDEEVTELVAAIRERAPGLFAVEGWHVEGRPPSDELAQAGVQGLSLPGRNGLPSAGTLQALRQAEEEL